MSGRTLSPVEKDLLILWFKATSEKGGYSRSSRKGESKQKKKLA